MMEAKPKLKKWGSFLNLRSKKKEKLWHSLSTDNVTYGAKAFTGDDQHARSSLDIRESGVETPTISRHKKIWNSLKKRTSRLRSSSREKSTKKVAYTDSVSDIPDLSTSPGASIQNLEDAFVEAESPVREMAMPSGFSQSKSEEKESEVDSGIAVVEHLEGQAVRQRYSHLRAHPFFVLDITLREGHDLVIRDSCGTSDPYVKFKIGGKQHYRSRIIYKTLNPRWNEKFLLPIEDPFKLIQVRVYDYDRGLNDDPMGGADIDLRILDLNVATDLKLMLTETRKKVKEQYMGYLTVTCKLIPKTQDDKEQGLLGNKYFKKMSKMSETAKKLKTQIWSSVVTIVLIEGKNLLPMDDNGFSDPYVKFRLGSERYKSKYKAKTLNPKWLEQFDLHMFDDQTSHLEISVWDHDTGGKDDIMGRAEIDLSTLEPEETHPLDVSLEDGAGFIRLLLSISGTSGSETISDLANYVPNPDDRKKIIKKYGLFKSFKGFKDIGWLQVKVIKAQGLAAADIGGKSDPFCVLELVNTRLQTQTEYKTLNPEWGKVFTFNIKDIHSVLEVTVYDEDRDKKCEFLGKIAIPLLRVRPGERRWYQLKDRKVMLRARGAIQLEMDLIFNNFKAAVRTFNPREDKYMQPDPKFKLSMMKRNIDRVTKIAQAGVEAGKFLQSCFDWESKIRSILAFAVFLVIVWNFELYMLPLTLLIIFLKNLLIVHIVGNLMKDREDDEYVDEEDDDDDDEKDTKEKKAKIKEEKKSFKEKLQAVQDVSLQVQEGMDMVASMGERVKNTFNWTVPWLSWLAVIILSIGVFVLYYVPLRYLIMAWGINKFTKKLRAPHAIPNNEVLDFLSRVPSDKELMMYRELRPDPSTGVAKKKRS